MMMKRVSNAAQSLWQLLSWGDRSLIAVVLISIIGFIPWLQTGLPGHAALVHVENKVVATLRLDKATELSVWGPLGETIVEVSEGKVRIKSDPGPQQRCVLQGWISRAGEALVCLPNRVLIQIPGEPDFDSLVK
jgi:hypothetical protein